MELVTTILLILLFLLFIGLARVVQLHIRTANLSDKYLQDMVRQLADVMSESALTLHKCVQVMEIDGKRIKLLSEKLKTLSVSLDDQSLRTQVLKEAIEMHLDLYHRH